MQASACMTVGKFGFGHHIKALKTWFRTTRRLDNVAGQQALIVLTGAGALSANELSEVALLSTVDSRHHIEFLRALMSGEQKAVGLTVGHSRAGEAQITRSGSQYGPRALVCEEDCPSNGSADGRAGAAASAMRAGSPDGPPRPDRLCHFPLTNRDPRALIDACAPNRRRPHPKPPLSTVNYPKRALTDSPEPHIFQNKYNHRAACLSGLPFPADALQWK